jgi:hypothetical protein
MTSDLTFTTMRTPLCSVLDTQSMVVHSLTKCNDKSRNNTEIAKTAASRTKALGDPLPNPHLLSQKPYRVSWASELLVNKPYTFHPLGFWALRVAQRILKAKDYCKGTRGFQIDFRYKVVVMNCKLRSVCGQYSGTRLETESAVTSKLVQSMTQKEDCGGVLQNRKADTEAVVALLKH